MTEIRFTSNCTSNSKCKESLELILFLTVPTVIYLKVSYIGSSHAICTKGVTI